MNLVAWTVFAAAFVAAPGELPAAPVTASFCAVEATREGRSEKYFSPGLDDIRAAVAELKFDTYRLVRAGAVKAPFGKETKVAINKRCNLYVAPMSKDEDGRIRVKVRIQLLPEDRKKKPVNAVVATCNVVQRKKLKLRLKQGDGELIFVLAFRSSTGQSRL